MLTADSLDDNLLPGADFRATLVEVALSFRQGPASQSPDIKGVLSYVQALDRDPDAISPMCYDNDERRENSQ